MAQGVSLTGLTVSIYSANVSLTATSTGLAAIQVNLLGTVSASGNTSGSTGPVSTSVFSYNFSLPRNSFYIATTAF